MKNDLEEFVYEIAKNQNFAIGNDVVFMPNFHHSFNQLFKQKVYTLKEINYCEQFDLPLLRYASTWAAKEATYKAIKQLFPDSLSFKKIEIIRTKIAGKPNVILPSKYAELEISLSLTHDGDYVWAVAILRKNK